MEGRKNKHKNADLDNGSGCCHSFQERAINKQRRKEYTRRKYCSQLYRYVITDSIGRKGIGCDIESDLDSSLAEDAIDNVTSLALAANTTQPVWLSIRIPVDAHPGIYKGTIAVEGADKELSLKYTVEVLNRTLPAPGNWKFHLDLWQNPFSIARIHGVENWSVEHLNALKPYMQMLADAGQKIITTSVIHDPWNSQTYDVYKSMVKWTLKKDGTWEYDYTVFDKWVSFMMSLGINKEINCYSMIPGTSSFIIMMKLWEKIHFLLPHLELLRMKITGSLC
jgi:hypothetical protein